MRRRSRLWWFFRFVRAYRRHGVSGYRYRRIWEDAQFARRMMDPEEQRRLGPLPKR